MHLLLDGTSAGPLDDATREDVADALCVLEDPRCEQPLVAALLDVARDHGTRSAVLRVLSCLPCDDPPRALVGAWLEEPDGLVRAFAASFLGPRDEDRLTALVRDPVVEVRRAAAEALVGAARTPGLVAAVRQALSDEDAIVRETACRAALFDEPVAATYDLLHLLDDEDVDVRCGVYDALEDYPCVSVLLALADARSGPDGALAAATLDLLVTRVEATLDAADAAGARRVRSWLAPAAWLLDESHDLGLPLRDADMDDDAPCEHEGVAPALDAAPPAARAPLDVGAAATLLADPDAPPAAQREQLVARDWSSAGATGLGVLLDVAASPLWSLRHGAAVALLDLTRSGAPGAADALLRLAEDVEPVVRRVALHALTHAGDPRAVACALATLADDGARAMAGDAALQAVAHLARANVAEATILAELQPGSDRDGLRLGAIHLAERLRIAAAAPRLAAIASTGIVAGTAAHVAALRALRNFGRPSRIDLAHLESVDHLDLQAELGAWDWHGPRYG